MADVLRGTRLLGRCRECRGLVFMHHPHEWAHAETDRACWPAAPGARLYCGRCSRARLRRAGAGG